MPKRRTSYNLSKLTDYQVRELTEKWDMTATEVVSLAVGRLYREQRWGLSAQEMTAGALLYTLLYERLDAARMEEMTRLAALSWCQAWLKEHPGPESDFDWRAAADAADAAVAAYLSREGGSDGYHF